MKLALLVICAALCGCEATFPLGEKGSYGEAYVGYRLPVRTFFGGEVPLYSDK